MQKPDSLIFDMDGTLWDPLNTYVAAWNAALTELNVGKQLKNEDVGPRMGMEKRHFLAVILPELSIEKQDEVYACVNKYRSQFVKEQGGILFEGVKEGLAELAKKYKLFIVSNCPEGVIRLFMDWADINDSITDEMAHGVNAKPKHYNINLLVEKYQLKNPIYIGDTDIDRQESELANIPFVFVSYGFGIAEKYDLTFNDFRSFVDHFLELD